MTKEYALYKYDDDGNKVINVHHNTVKAVMPYLALNMLTEEAHAELYKKVFRFLEPLDFTGPNVPPSLAANIARRVIEEGEEGSLSLVREPKEGEVWRYNPTGHPAMIKEVDGDNIHIQRMGVISDTTLTNVIARKDFMTKFNFVREGEEDDRYN